MSELDLYLIQCSLDPQESPRQRDTQTTLRAISVATGRILRTEYMRCSQRIYQTPSYVTVFRRMAKTSARALHSPTAHTTHYLPPQKAACRTQHCCYAAPSVVPSVSDAHTPTPARSMLNVRGTQRFASTSARRLINYARPLNSSDSEYCSTSATFLGGRHDHCWGRGTVSPPFVCLYAR